MKSFDEYHVSVVSISNKKDDKKLTARFGRGEGCTLDFSNKHSIEDLKVEYSLKSEMPSNPVFKVSVSHPFLEDNKHIKGNFGIEAKGKVQYCDKDCCVGIPAAQLSQLGTNAVLKGHGFKLSGAMGMCSKKESAKLDLSYGREFAVRDVKMKASVSAPSLDLFDFPDSPKDFLSDVKIGASANVCDFKIDASATDFGRDVELTVRDSVCKFFTGKTTIALTDLNPSISFTRSLDVNEHFELAFGSKISHKDSEVKAKHRAGIVYKPSDKLSARAMVDSERNSSFEIKQKINDNSSISVVGKTSEGVHPIFGVNFTFD